jgi:ABC-2 type transport system permease protein
MQSAMYFRAAFIFNLFTPLLLLAGQYMLWSALYAQQGDGATIGAFSKETMYTYILLSFFVSNILTWKSENDLSRKIITGSIVTECVRPASFILQNLADMTGAAVLQGTVNLFLVIIIFFCIGHTLIVAPLLHIASAVISLVLGIIIRMLLISVVSLLCFLTTSHLGISWTRGAITEFFSGAVIPISLFPAAFQAVDYCTPFPLMLHIPLSIYLGQHTYYALPMVFALQVFWILFLFGLQSFCWNRIRRNITIVGG